MKEELGAIEAEAILTAAFTLEMRAQEDDTITGIFQAETSTKTDCKIAPDIKPRIDISGQRNCSPLRPKTPSLGI